MSGQKGKSGGNHGGAGRPPQSSTLRIGDGIAIRYGAGTSLEQGNVTAIKRNGRMRTVVFEMADGTTVWLLAETPSAGQRPAEEPHDAAEGPPHSAPRP